MPPGSDRPRILGFNVDNVVLANDACPFIVADLSNFGQTLDALSSVDTGVYGKTVLQAFDAIVHLVANTTRIPALARGDLLDSRLSV